MTYLLNKIIQHNNIALNMLYKNTAEAQLLSIKSHKAINVLTNLLYTPGDLDSPHTDTVDLFQTIKKTFSYLNLTISTKLKNDNTIYYFYNDKDDVDKLDLILSNSLLLLEFGRLYQNFNINIDIDYNKINISFPDIKADSELLNQLMDGSNFIVNHVSTSLLNNSYKLYVLVDNSLEFVIESL
jgi:hypothetical protein